MEKNEDLVRTYLPIKIKCEIECNKINFKNITEIRLRVNCPLIVYEDERELLCHDCIVKESDIQETFNMITEYSAYSFEESIKMVI